MDIETRRRIDTARDILVGKVPDPKSQVEQITIAMIYKFMNDMDDESEELGGERKFFAGGFKQYSWSNLINSGLGGYEMLNRYAEAIQRMPENPGIPPLFRDIFKNAYLPYRDPGTLRAFLNVIDEFTYDHSERLGDAFEYLLSVLGSQGDAGQFRTPRHIIEFIVSIVDPKKNEVVLDPACGTAGFLISAFKHILSANIGADGYSTLTPEERGRLAQNFRGYDISPDMVRLSLVNLYLHGFTDPHIYEYDTLTSEDRWNEYADVILANPPFMSPKGGIRPHKRFGVESKRSEVLFVCYMMQHLTPTGRAGIIVPEGVVFQSQTAYKQLRQMLVNDYLVAVISLPAGVFQPYSGVKTSVLILDRQLAKKAGHVAFFKVQNDGFDLGAQRRTIEQDDLPEVVKEVREYLRWLTAGSVESCGFRTGLIVEKTRVAEDGEYSLSGDRYRAPAERSSKYQYNRLGDVCLINPDIRKPDDLDQSSPFFSYIDIECVENGSGKFLGAKRLLVSEAPSRARRGVMANDVLLSTVRPNLKAFTLLKEVPDRAIASTGFAVLRAKSEQISPGFLIYLLRHERAVEQMVGMMGKGAYPSINQSDVAQILVPLPPIEVQQEIAAEIAGYQKVIDGARAVVENYRPHISIDPDWPMVKLGEVCDVRDGTHDSPKYVLEGYPLITSKNLRNGIIDFSNVNLISRKDLDAINRRSKVDAGDILMPMIGTIGNPVIADVSREYAVKNVALIKFNGDSRIDNRFLRHVLASANMQKWFELQAGGSTQQFISLGFIRSLPIPLPSLAEQQAIVVEIEAEQALVNVTGELTSRFQKKIEAALTRVWGGDQTS